MPWIKSISYKSIVEQMVFYSKQKSTTFRGRLILINIKKNYLWYFNIYLYSY